MAVLWWGPWVLSRGLTRLAATAWWWGAHGRRRLLLSGLAGALLLVALWLPAVGVALTVAVLAVAVALGWAPGPVGWPARGRDRPPGERRPEAAGAGLPTGVAAQRFPAGPGEVVLGLTDAAAADRMVPARDGCGRWVEVAPLVWRTGPRATAPHLLAVGTPGAGATSLLRWLALQALAGGEVVLVDGSGVGEFACFAGRSGVWGAETTPEGAVSGLSWVARETERRLLLPGGERRASRPLWVLVDRPALLAHLAWVAGAGDPLGLLDVPLRYGREAGVTVVVAEQVGAWESLAGALVGCTRARVVLGAVAAEEASAVLGGVPPGGVGSAAGDGFARLGTGGVCRLRVPATPDPWDEAGDRALRRAVWELLPAPASPEVAAGD
ncbi:hypothetical protein [Streptomyces profundus]|uniref:hypothetical protein n=1 Tax=Streptomyces profundus TaxID=2867410 RepID=UPI001D16D8FB|nr:hypothetical protein [Streptomyces sp. MA3_2.13]UED82783.1 hypothetical protein K4G22_00125 [Streptomyces sp. MA3_2.13]